jgi:cytochrome b
MRLAPQWGGATGVSQYRLTVRQGVPRFTHVLLGLLLLATWPLRLAWQQFRFEMARWSESDHPWAEEGG